MLKTGQAIAALRRNADMTQEQLASALFVSRDLVSKWETGKSPPNYQMILKMAKLFSVGVEALFDRDRVLTEELSPCLPPGLTVGGGGAEGGAERLSVLPFPPGQGRVCPAVLFL